MSSFLEQFQRQPKLFIDLPSGGKFYDESVLNEQQTIQIPVFGMNAMDEILFKTPDSLFSGESTAKVIHSCIPTVIDPWKLVGYDIDYVLISMRIATYGEMMPITSTCPTCGTQTESDINLTGVLDNFSSLPTEFSFTLKELTFDLEPLTYKETTSFSMRNYALERQLYQIGKIEDDEERFKQQQQIYKLQSDLNLDLATAYIKGVRRGDEVENDPVAITEFVKNNDAEMFSMLKNKILEMTNVWHIPDMTVTCSGEDCDREYKTKINVDYSSFFGVSSLHSRNLISKM